MDFKVSILCTSLASPKCRELEYAYLSRQRYSHNRRIWERSRKEQKFAILPPNPIPSTTTTIQPFIIHAHEIEPVTPSAYDLYKERYQEVLKRHEEEKRRREDSYARRVADYVAEVNRRRAEDAARREAYLRGLRREQTPTTQKPIQKMPGDNVRGLRIKAVHRRRRHRGYFRCRLEWVHHKKP